MNTQNGNSKRRNRLRRWSSRKGIVVPLAAFALVVVFAFVALAIDSGRINLAKTEMQNAVDAASLAAAQEITKAIEELVREGVSGSEANAMAVAAARSMAAQVAEANDVFVDADNDVQFGKRTFDEASGEWPIQWGVSPFNVVRVSARRMGDDTEAPGGKLPLAFGWAVGMDSAGLEASATAFVESRDIVVCLDFSASMNDDSSMKSFNSLGQAEVEGQLDAMWDALRAADPKWPGTSESKFPAEGLGGVNSYEGTYVSSWNDWTVYYELGFDEVTFPQAGRYSDGTPKNKPSASYSESRWHAYIDFVQNKSGPYNRKYGYRTLMDYLQEKRYKSKYSEDLWRTPHYPFNAVKEGCTLFCEYLADLQFADEVGLVSYGGYSMKEMYHSDGEVNIDISGNPITSDYETLDTLQRRHQAGDYDGWTGMGYAIQDAREMLQEHLRYGARPTMLIMTDGQTNQGPSGWSMPSGFSWSDWTDYDGDGNADYSTGDSKKQYAFFQAVEAIEHGVTIHTMAVGQGADRDLMRAIAHAGGGIFISVPGGTTIEQIEEDVMAAFEQIAAKVPPAKLVYDIAGPQ